MLSWSTTCLRDEGRPRPWRRGQGREGQEETGQKTGGRWVSVWAMKETEARNTRRTGTESEPRVSYPDFLFIGPRELWFQFLYFGMGGTGPDHG